MSWHDLSSEELVLHFLSEKKLSKVSLVHDIEVDCVQFWHLFSVYRSASTYRRAFQRLIKEGRLGRHTVKTASGVNGARYSYRVFCFDVAINKGLIECYTRISHQRAGV